MESRQVTKSERIVFDAIRQQLLPGEEMLERVRFSDSRHGDVEADALIFIPNAGVAVLEIKGGLITYVDGQWTVNDENGYQRRINPVEQGRKAKHTLRRYLDRQVDWQKGLIRTEWFVAMPFTQVDGDMGPEGRRELLIGKSDVPNMLKQIRDVLTSPLNADPFPNDSDIQLALSLLKRPGNTDLVIGYGPLENRKVRGLLLGLFIAGLNTAIYFLGFNEEIEIAAGLVSIAVSLGLGSIAMQSGLIGNRHMKFYSTIGVVATLIGFGLGYTAHNKTHNQVTCDTNYSGCVPEKSDVDCSDLDDSVKVIREDVYALDRDGDGNACEWNEKTN
jgi:hypothetical protein